MKHLKISALGFLSVALLALPACQTMDTIAHDIKNIDLGLPPLSSSPDAESADYFVSGNGCPKVEIIEDLSSFNEFTNAAKMSEPNLISRVHLTQIESKCTYTSKTVSVDLKLAFEGALGAQARLKSGDKPFFSYPFFIAVTSPGGDILAKEVFAAPMTYQSGQTHQTYYETLRQLIPVPSKSKGARYKVLAGFQLSEDQLDYNRAMIRSAKEAEEIAQDMEETKNESQIK